MLVELQWRRSNYNNPDRWADDMMKQETVQWEETYQPEHITQASLFSNEHSNFSCSSSFSFWRFKASAYSGSNPFPSEVVLSVATVGTVVSLGVVTAEVGEGAVVSKAGVMGVGVETLATTGDGEMLGTGLEDGCGFFGVFASCCAFFALLR
jgi:hypothetical protein